MNNNSENLVNQIRVSATTQVKNIIRYSNTLLKERNMRDIFFSGLGGAIGKIVAAVEILKIQNAGLYQLTKIETVTFSTKDDHNNLITERQYPRMEVTLTLDEPKEKGVGFQDKLSEEVRLKMLGLLNQGTQKRQERRQAKFEKEKNHEKNNRNQRYSPRSNKGQKEVPRGPQQNNHPNQRQNPSRTEKSKPNPKSNDGQRSSQMEFQPMRGGMMRGGFRGGRGVARGPENMQRDTQRRSPIPREVNSGQFRGGDRGRFANMLLL